MITKFAAGIVVASATLTTLGQVKPDLVVAGLTVDPDALGQFVARVSVTVSNVCRGSEANTSFVIVTFKENSAAASKSIYFVGSRVRPLKGGESQTLTFDAAASAKQIALGSFVLAEVDPYGKTSEASESNNQRTLNPSGGGNASSPAQCRR